MNKIYKIVWNEVRQCYIVVSEFAKGKVKGTSPSRISLRQGTCQKIRLHKKRLEPAKLLAATVLLAAVTVSPLGGGRMG